MPALRVVLDTNVIVSGLAYPGSVPGRIVGAWRLGGIELVVSRYILDEVARGLPRLSRAALTADEIRDLIDGFMFLADMVEPLALDDPALRDRVDLPILGTWAAGKAAYLVTGDKALLTLAGRYPILTPADFWSRHGG